jgi:stage II sporulation protein D
VTGARRLVTASLALLGAAACHPHGPALPLPGTEPELRVGLADGLKRITLGGDAQILVTDDANGAAVAGISAGAIWSVVPDSGALVLIGPDGTRTGHHLGISAVSATANHFVAADGKRYRGRVNVIRTGTGLQLINRVGLESYVAAVIGPELGPRREDELQALDAQAIVSRTFALKNRGRWEPEGFDVTDDTRDQLYGGVAAETPQAWAAVRRTVGRVVMFHGDIIDAFFHSTCGFRTADPTEAFRNGASRPYLRSVSDASGGGHYYCDISPRFRWREEWDGATLRTILARSIPDLQRIVNVEVARTSPSGRVAELRIVFPHGQALIPEPDVRSVLRPAPDRLLQSAAFQLFVTTESGAVSRLVAAGAGSGHGVGFCQWGAIGRARAGQGYQEIITTYFPGTDIEKLY